MMSYQVHSERYHEYHFFVDFLEIVLLVIDTDLCENGRGTNVFAEEVDLPAGIK